jgi:malate dehydrogenase (oxaloacetate-decarboxylating)
MKRMQSTILAAILATSDEEVSPDYVIPSVFNRHVARRVGRAVTDAARGSGLARRVHKTTSIPG